jgi:hypothetical protein
MPVNPDIHIKVNPKNNLYAFRGLSGTRFVSAIIKKTRLHNQIIADKIQNSFFIFKGLFFIYFTGRPQEEVQDWSYYRDKNHNQNKHYIVISLKFAFQNVDDGYQREKDETSQNKQQQNYFSKPNCAHGFKFLNDT